MEKTEEKKRGRQRLEKKYLTSENSTDFKGILAFCCKICFPLELLKGIP